MIHKLIQRMLGDWPRQDYNAANQCRPEEQAAAKVAWRDQGPRLTKVCLIKISLT